MKQIIYLFVFCSLPSILFACDITSQTKIAPSISNVNQMANHQSDQPSTSTTSNKSDGIREFTIYSVLLSYIIYDSEWSNTITTNNVIVKKKTISPQNTDVLKSYGISDTLIEGFKEKNKIKESLAERYDVKATVNFVDGAETVADIFEKAKKKYPNSKSAIGLSRIGVDERNLQALVYVEFFASDVLQKKFCTISLNKEMNVECLSAD